MSDPLVVIDPCTADGISLFGSKIEFFEEYNGLNRWRINGEKSTSERASNFLGYKNKGQLIRAMKKYGTKTLLKNGLKPLQKK